MQKFGKFFTFATFKILIDIRRFYIKTKNFFIILIDKKGNMYLKKTFKDISINVRPFKDD